jgi:hypothetical protein
MLSALAEKAIITKDFAENLDRVRNTKFFFEWGTGAAPEEEEIQYVEKNAGRLLKSSPLRSKSF